MIPDDFRHLYDYHFALNHRLWQRGIAPLPAAQFRRPLAMLNQLGVATFPQDYALYAMGKL